MTATKIQPGDDLHLTSLMAPHSLNFVTGPDRAALLAYGRDVFAAGLAGAAPAAVSQRGEYPQLPEGVMFIEQVGGDVIGRPTDYGFKHGRGIVHGAELFTSEQLRAYFDLGRQPSTAAPALEAPPAVAPQGEYPHEQMDAMALARYKVVPSHASMLWSHAVVAGDGAQQLYVGREVECQNMARKFAGAFLDGAFAFHSMAAAPTAQAAPALEAPAAPVGSARQFIEWMYSQPEDREPTTAEGALLEFEAHLAAAAPQAPAAPAVDAWLQPDDMAALQRFHETAEDDESYDIGKEAVARLCAFGCLQSHSFGRYSTTDFGDYLLDTWAGARTLPFTTAAERAAQAKEGGAACA